jgi:X-Pro dipeptidyl-peptidase
VRIHISRPGETESDGIDVPVVFEHSPYRGEFGDAVNHNVDFDVLPQEHLRPRGGARRGGTEARRGWSRARQRADLPGGLDNRYVPRGYAVILGEGIGSAGSDGCPTIGDSDEALSTRAVID